MLAQATAQKEDISAQWVTVMRLAQMNGASLRGIAARAGIAPQTVANLPRD